MPNQVDIDIDDEFISIDASSIIGGSTITGSSITGGSITASNSPNFNVAGNTTPAPNYTFTVNAPYGTPALTMMDPISTNPKLPAIVFASHCDAGIPITMTLEPESSISQWEVLQLTLMLHAAMAGATFGAFQFVAKAQLERHFKYAR